MSTNTNVTVRNPKGPKVPVGATPVPKFATWAEHRESIRRDAHQYRNRTKNN